MQARRPATASAASGEGTKIDRLALEYLSADGLPGQFTCHRSQEVIFNLVQKGALQRRAAELGLDTERASPAQLLKKIGYRLVKEGRIPDHLVALRHLGGDQMGREVTCLKCWRCGGDVPVEAANVVDFQVGSWPPGDQRRWRQGGSWIIPAVICPHTVSAEVLPKDDAQPVLVSQGRVGVMQFNASEGAVKREAQREEESKELKNNIHQIQPQETPTSRRRERECAVGNFRTIAGVFVEGVWMTVKELLKRCGGVENGLCNVPVGETCIERVAVQLFNWMSMSGEAQDKNYLPCRVYLTREAKLVCRNGSAVGYVSFNSSPTESFPVPTLNAVYVMPEARGKGACTDILIDFFRKAPGLAQASIEPCAKKEEKDGGRAQVGPQSGATEEGQEGVGVQESISIAVPGKRENGVVGETETTISDVKAGNHTKDCDREKGLLVGMRGIEAPVSDALLRVVPKVLTREEMCRILVLLHGDSKETASRRESLWDLARVKIQ